ncbi:MAG: hypothetical protein RKO66_10790 [Candidatus Contendobacter sp.]|nr:hypothetical protein [Candidatus Contendobacter sp.]MDS4058740.1 hypothetical protein [Candidatus Contendobacter sp.]
MERAQVRAASARRNHIGPRLRAFLRLEWHCYRTDLSWFEAKTAILRSVIRAYLANPLYTFRSDLISRSLEFRTSERLGRK